MTIAKATLFLPLPKEKVWVTWGSVILVRVDFTAVTSNISNIDNNMRLLMMMP